MSAAFDMWWDEQEADIVLRGVAWPKLPTPPVLSPRKEATIARDTRALHRSLGLCAYCKTPSARYRCAWHYESANEQRRRSRAQLRATGATSGPRSSSGSKEGRGQL